MDKSAKRGFSLFLAILMLSVMCVVPAQAIPTKTGEIVSFNQYGTEDWCKYPYGYQDKDEEHRRVRDPGTIGTSGCGLVALTNAVYYLNGNFINPTVLADYSLSHGYRSNGRGTDDAMYKPFINEHGSEYNIEYVGVVEGEGSGINKVRDGLERLKKHLRLGRVAICWKDLNRTEYGHFMAIVDWDAVTNKFLLLDSAPNSGRGTAPNGYAWKTADELYKKPVLLGAKFHVIRNTDFRYISRYLPCTFRTALNRKMALDVLGGHHDNGTNIQTYTVHNGGAQTFSLEHVDDGWHKIRHIESGKVLDIAGINRASGTNVFLWEDTGGLNQLWRLIPSGNGYRIQSRLGTYLDVQGGYADDFINVWAYEGNGTDAQLWYPCAK